MRRAQEGREDLLGVCAAKGAIPATTHFARDDGGPECVLGAPVGSVERRIEEEAEHRVVFGGEMDGEAPRVGQATGPTREQMPEAIEVGAPGDGETVLGHDALGMAITRGQRGAQERVDLGSKPMMRIIQHHRAAATEQMRQTGLMRGVGKVAVGCPAIALQDAGVLGPEHPRGLREAAPVFDRIGRGVRSGKGPEPIRVAADFPARFIRGDGGTRAHLRAQRLVGRLGLARRAMHRLDHAAARDGEAEALVQQRHDATTGEAALFIQDHRQRDGLRAELHRGGAERIGGLQQMPSLYATMTVPALADRDTKFMHHGTLHGQVFLVLRDDALPPHGPTAVRTLRGQRRLMPVIDLARPGPMRLPAIGGARFATWPLGVRLRQPTRKGRRLPLPAAPRHLELFSQAFVLATQSIAFVLRPHQILAQSFDLAGLIVDDLPGLTRRRRVLRAPRHTPVMPNPRKKYKSNHVEYAM